MIIGIWFIIEQFFFSKWTPFNGVMYWKFENGSLFISGDGILKNYMLQYVAPFNLFEFDLLNWTNTLKSNLNLIYASIIHMRTASKRKNKKCTALKVTLKKSWP